MEPREREESWLDTATRGIRFRPDRQAVREELAGHLEDKAADLQRIFPDMTFKEARDRALGEMGDPEEIGRTLALLHRPWLGYLWQLSRVLVWPWAAVGAVYVLILLLSGPFLWLFGGWEFRESILPLSGSGEPAGQIALEPVEDSVWISGCRLTVEEAYLTPEGEDMTLTVRFRIFSPYIWAEEWTFPEQITAQDSLGNTWCSWAQRGPEGARTVEPGGGEAEYLLSLPHLFTSRVQVQVPQVAPQAEWIRLDYNWQGREFSITVERKEAGK